MHRVIYPSVIQKYSDMLPFSAMSCPSLFHWAWPTDCNNTFQLIGSGNNKKKLHTSVQMSDFYDIRITKENHFRIFSTFDLANNLFNGIKNKGKLF